jgi:hypothetical protein
MIYERNRGKNKVTTRTEYGRNIYLDQFKTCKKFSSFELCPVDLPPL